MKTKPELTLEVITRKNTSYLPSQVAFSTGPAKEKVVKAMGFSSWDEFDEYIDNDYKMTCQMDDVVCWYCGEVDKMELAAERGWGIIDREKNRITDRWGMKFDINAPSGFFNYSHPLLGLLNDPSILNSFKAPSLDDMDNLFSLAMEEKKKYENKFLVMVNGYCGIFERAYNLVGFNEFMMMIALEPDLAGRLMDIITDYKIEIAKECVKRGFKMAHHGDDLGTQITTFFSVDIFRKLIKPRLKRLLSVYKDAGIPIQMHSCGNITSFIPDLIDIGLDVLEPVQPCMNISFLKREYGKDLTFYGGIDTQDLLPFQSPKKVREEVLRTIDILGHNGDLIIAPSQEIMPNVPVENVISMIETIKEAKGNR